MWHFLFGKPASNDDVMWECYSGAGSAHGLTDENGVMIAIGITDPQFSRFASIRTAAARIKRSKNSDWISPEEDTWLLDLDALVQSQSTLRNAVWIKGQIVLEPELERRRFRLPSDSQFDAALAVYITSDMLDQGYTAQHSTIEVLNERWEKTRKLGSGGQGTVWIVRDLEKTHSTRAVRELLRRSLSKRLRRTIAIEKAVDEVLDAMVEIGKWDDTESLAALKQLNAPGEARDPTRAMDRIRNEMEAMSRISHPNLLKILDSDSDKLWFVSEYHAGGTLVQAQPRFTGSVEASMRAVRSLVAGVAEIHKRKLVHRDIKPENIFFSKSGELVLGDFGLVYFSDRDQTRLSATMENVGTWDWMPIWAQGMRLEDVRPTFDVFSLGKLLWWMISGMPIQRLRLWLIDEDGDIEKLHRSSRFIQRAKSVLKKCVVKEESQCLPDAVALLDEIDACLSAIDEGADFNPRQWHCKACGNDFYVRFSENEVENSCLGSPDRRMRIYCCSQCGHFQLFDSEQKMNQRRRGREDS